MSVPQHDQGLGLAPSRRRPRVARRAILAAGLIGVLALARLWPEADPWPPSVVLTRPPRSGLFEWADDGRLVFGTRAGTVRLDPATGRAETEPTAGLTLGRVLTGDRRHFAATAFAVDDTRQVVRGDAASGRVEARFGDAKLEVFHPTIEPGERSIRVFLRDGRGAYRLRQVVAWDPATGAASRHPITGPAWVGPLDPSGVVAPDGRTIAYVDRARRGVQLWDVDADRPIGGLLGAGPTPLSESSEATFTPDGRQVVLCRAEGRAELWDRDGTLVRAFAIHTGYDVMRAVISPDGRTLAAQGIIPPPRSWARRAAWAARSYLAPVEHRRATCEVALVDLATGRRVARAAGDSDVLFSPDGRRVATTGYGDALSIRAVPTEEGR